jgi:hypothetical protein
LLCHLALRCEREGILAPVIISVNSAANILPPAVKIQQRH